MQKNRVHRLLNSRQDEDIVSTHDNFSRIPSQMEAAVGIGAPEQPYNHQSP
jgi:hypothetical protein